MKEMNDFLLSKINELEIKVFELEKRLKAVEDKNLEKSTSEVIKEETVVNTKVERYLFNGESYKKNQLVLAVIKKFVQEHPGVTESQLSSAFPAHECKCSYPVVKEEKAIPAKHKGDVPRYFIKSKHLIELDDGTVIAVCNQWGTNIPNFIECAKKHGYKIEKE